MPNALSWAHGFDHESLSSHWVRSAAQVADLEPQPDFGCRLLTIDHGRADALAGAVHAVDSRYIRSFLGECEARDRFGTPGRSRRTH
jgi:hypothetical protein